MSGHNTNEQEDLTHMEALIANLTASKTTARVQAARAPSTTSPMHSRTTTKSSLSERLLDSR